MQKPANPTGRIPAIAILLLALCCSACLEQPIDEQLALDFGDEGSVEVEVTVDFLDDSGEAQRASVRERVAERRQALLEGRDDWARRFEPLEPASERYGWEKKDGRLTHFVQSAVLGDPGRDLRRFFSDTPVTVFYERREKVSELVLETGPPTRADRRQRERVRSHIDGYTEAIARYIEETAALWDYLAQHPDRARPCLGAVFEELLPEGTREALEEVDDEEDELLEALTEAMEQVAEVLEVGNYDGYSMDELSRLVFDPFPAEIVVSVPGEIETVEGFAELGDGRLRIRPLGFWAAFASLAGRWMSPDPLVTYVSASLEEATFDLDGFLARKRHVESVPGPDVVEEVLLDRLQPEVSYRVLWRGAATDVAD